MRSIDTEHKPTVQVGVGLRDLDATITAVETDANRARTALLAHLIGVCSREHSSVSLRNASVTDGRGGCHRIIIRYEQRRARYNRKGYK